MTDDGLEPVEVTGRWVGFYRHRWEQLGTYPIIAVLCQNGDKITGEMYDQITNRSQYLDDFVEVIGKDIAYESRRRFEQVIGRFGRRPSETLVCLTRPTSRERSRGAMSSSRRPTEVRWRSLGLSRRSRSAHSGETVTRFTTLVTLIGIGCLSQEDGSLGKGGCLVGSCRHKVGAALSFTRSLESGRRKGTPVLQRLL